MSLHTRPNPRGFTLIELLVVVAIAAILGSIAYPTYSAHIIRSRRAEATAVLAEAAHFMERAALDNKRYDQDLSGAAIELPAGLKTSPKGSTTPAYDVSLLSVSADGFVLQATPRAGTSQADDPCGTLTLSSAGVAEPATEGCWRR
jgi:type IV pilus assembly protein PilE